MSNNFFSIGLLLASLFYGTFDVVDAAEGIDIPLGGNGFITKKGGSNTDNSYIGSDGLNLWSDHKTIISVYFKFTKTEKFQLALKVKPYGESQVTVTIAGKHVVASFKGEDPYTQFAGRFTAGSGYIKVDLQGKSKTGDYYADVESLVLFNITGKIYYISDPNIFGYGRRGPSVHMNYRPKTTKPIEYFYNEVTVPKEQDVYGCYFMVAGFSDGYFGLQHDEPNSKRVLFSVWSDMNTNDPTMVKEEMKVDVFDHGKNVVVEDFGNEGAGKKTSLIYDWKTETTYKFLIFGSPAPNNRGTNYTGWFKPPESKEWKLMASVYKPLNVPKYLTSLYSFSENFIAEQGWITRRVTFGNQWVRKVSGKWEEVVTALYTGDETSRSGREDYAGGLTPDRRQFYLRNIGFFNDKVDTYQEFTRIGNLTKPPHIRVSKLHKNLGT